MKVFVDKNKVNVKFSLVDKILKFRFKDTAGNKAGFLVFVHGNFSIIMVLGSIWAIEANSVVVVWCCRC
jgi:hypothetical protein